MAVNPAVGWWQNASDTAPYTPKLLEDFGYQASGTPVGSATGYAQSSAQLITNRGATLVLSVGFLTSAQANQICTACIAAGQGNVVFRVAWEQNTNYINAIWDYRSGLSAASWITDFTTTAGYLKAAMPGCKIVWNPVLTNTAPGGRTPYDTFPGSACDYVAFDGYDAVGSVAAWTSEANTFISLANNTWNKPWGIGEWGLSNLYGANGGDDPAYIDAVAVACTTANHCIFQIYFSSSGAGGFVSELSNYPDCKARYIADFPSDGGTWPPVLSGGGSGTNTPITAVGSLATINTLNGGTTLTVNPTTIGNMLVVTVETGAGVTLTNVGGGGVTTWTNALAWLPTGDREIWFGAITATGPSTITFTWSGSTGSHNVEYSAHEFSAGQAVTWQGTGVSNEIAITGTSTNMQMPALTPIEVNDLYVGMAVPSSDSTGSGVPAGYSFLRTAWGNTYVFNPQCGASTQAPSALQTVAGTSHTFAVMLRAMLSAAAVGVSGGNSNVSISAPSPSVTTTSTGGNATISAVGSLATVNTTNGGTTLSVTPATIGDLMVVTVETGAGVHITTVSGGGVTTWNKSIQWVPTGDREIWWGIVTTAGAATITFAWSGSTGTHNVEYCAQEFAASPSAVNWQSTAVTGDLINSSSSTNIAMPSLTPAEAADLYVGLAVTATSANGGATSGYTFSATAWGNVYVYNPQCSAAVQAPTAAQTPAGTSQSIAAMFRAAIIPTTTVVPTTATVSVGPSAPSVQLAGTIITITPATAAVSVAAPSPSQSLGVTAGCGAVTVASNMTFTTAPIVAGVASVTASAYGASTVPVVIVPVVGKAGATVGVPPFSAH